MNKPEIEDYYDVSDPRGISSSEYAEFEKDMQKWKALTSRESINSPIPLKLEREGRVVFQKCTGERRCACCENGEHIFSRHIEFLPDGNLDDNYQFVSVADLALEFLLKRDDLHGRKVRVIIETVD